MGMESIDVAMSGFCSMTCSMEELDGEIQERQSSGDIVSSAYLEGVKYARLTFSTATGLTA